MADEDTIVTVGADRSIDGTITGRDVSGGARSDRLQLVRGSSVGRFVVLDRLGAGGMGVVYAAYDPELDRKVALKLVPADTGHGGEGSPGATRLLREAQSMARLSHPNVVAIYDVGSIPGAVYLAMENIDGHTLTAWLAQTPRSLREILATFVAAGRGIAAAHAAGLVHRDFKPDNVMIGSDGRVRVLDFGLARPSRSLVDESDDGEHSSGSWSPASHLELRLTATGTVMGTPHYMAPEQHLGRPTDERCDIYAFSVSLWEAVFRARPFKANSLADLAIKVVSGQIEEPPRTAGVPRWLRSVLRRGLAPDPAQRFASMPAMLAALERDRTRRLRWLAGGAALVIAVAGGAAAMRHVATQASCDDGDSRLAGVWDGARKDAIAAAFAAEGKTYTDASWRNVERTLDAYADGIAGMRREACEATRILGTQSDEVLGLRMRCLDRRWYRLATLTELLASGGTQTVLHAVDAAQALPSPGPCADVEGLLAEVPPPDDPQVAATVEEIRAENERIETAGIAGRLDGLRERIEANVAAARATEYRPAIAESLLLLGNLLQNYAQVEPAAAALEEALAIAQALGYDRVIARAATILAAVEANGRNRFEVAGIYVAMADGVITRMGDDPRLRIQLLTKQGSIASAQGQQARAAERLERAAELAGELGLSGSELLAILNPLASALMESDRRDEAAAVLERARRVVDDEVGPDHPNAAALLGALARLRHAEGRYEDALALERRAHAVFVAALGPDHRNVGAMSNAMGLTYARLGRDREARDAFAAAVAVIERGVGPEHLTVATGLTNLGRAEVRVGQPREGVTHLRRALAIREAKLGKDDATTAESRHDLGDALAATGEYDEADRSYRAAIATFEAEGLLARSAYPWIGLGESLLAQGRIADAIAALDKGLDRATEDEPGPAERGDGRFALARALARGERDAPRIAELVRGAEADYAAAGASRARERAALAGWRAAPP